MHYQQAIYRIDPAVNPAGVEGSMRLQYGTLDHLPHETFVAETALARQCEEASPGFLRGVAESYGMADQFDAWETIKVHRETMHARERCRLGTMVEIGEGENRRVGEIVAMEHDGDPTLATVHWHDDSTGPAGFHKIKPAGPPLKAPPGGWPDLPRS